MANLTYLTYEEASESIKLELLEAMSQDIGFSEEE